MTDNGRRPRVALIFTGGTIDSVGVDRLDLAFYIEANKRLTTASSWRGSPSCRRSPTSRRSPSAGCRASRSRTPTCIDLVATIHQMFDEDRADGVVITHGTNTLEETAYFLHLTLKRDRPVVVVGAMRPSSGHLAPMATSTCSTRPGGRGQESRGMGVLVVLNDTIHVRPRRHQDRDLSGRDVPGPRPRPARLRRQRRSRPVTTTGRCASTRPRPSSTWPASTRCRRVDVVVSLPWRRRHDDRRGGRGRGRAIVSGGTGAGRPTPGEDAALDRASRGGRGRLPGDARRLRADGHEPRPSAQGLVRGRQPPALEGADPARPRPHKTSDVDRDPADVRHLLRVGLMPVRAARRGLDGCFATTRTAP